MTDHSQHLQGYLMDAAKRKFSYHDGHDCCTFPADWVISRTDLDPYDRWRGSYGNKEQAQFHIMSAGSLAKLWMLGMIDVGIAECDEPQLGDVGIVEYPDVDGFGQIGAIFTGRRWAMLTEQGVIIASADCVISWRI